MDSFLWEQTRNKINRLADIVLFTYEASNASRSEMLGVFFSYFDEGSLLIFVSLVEVSSTSSEIVMATVEKVMHDKNVDIMKTRFSSLEGTNSMSGEHNELQWRIRNYAPHAICINWACHCQLQEAYGMKALAVVKAAVTRWLSYGAACKRCRERYSVIVEALDDIIIKNPKPELIGYRSQVLDSTTILKVCFLSQTHYHWYSKLIVQTLVQCEEP